MSHNPDTYYNRSEVSNSDLTELKNILHPRMQFGDKEAAFRFGSLVDAIITEPARVDYYRLTVDDVSGIGGSAFLAVILKPHLPQHSNSLKKRLTSSIGTGVVLGIWTLQVPTVISFMLSAKRTAKYSRSSSIGMIRSTTVDARNMKNWLSNTGV